MSDFSFSPQNAKKAQEICKRYPKERKQSAVLPLLDLAQRQNEGWLSPEAIACVAELVKMPEIRVQELVHFYSMFLAKPRGKYLVQLCRTTPCWLKGSDDIRKACLETLGIAMGETTADNLFTVVEVECLGACCNAPMMQVNDFYYEDLTPESAVQILESLRAGNTPKVGSQSGRTYSAPKGLSKGFAKGLAKDFADAAR